MPTVYDNTAPYQVVSYASAARTTDPTAVTHVNKGNFNVAQVFISCTVRAGAASTTFAVATWNSKANTWVTLLTSAAVTVAAETMLQIGGVGTAVANVSTAIHPGKKIRITPVHGTADAHTYSVTTSWLRA